MKDDNKIEITPNEAPLVESILKEISDVVRSIDDAQQVMERLVDMATTLLNVSMCSLVMVDPKTREMRIRAAKGLSPEIIRRYSGRVGEGIAGHVAETGKPLLVEDVETHPLFARKSGRKYTTKSLLSVPLIHEAQVIGVLNVNNRNDGGVLTRSDELLLSVLANFVVLAIEKSRMQRQLIRTERYEAELRVAREIQDRVLAREWPHPSHWEFAVRSVPARMVGGDFFDAMALPNDRTCVVIGDVCGKGVPAALYMARVLGYFRVVAKVRDKADEIMTFVNDLLASEWSERTFVTATVCVLDGRSGRVSICSAGHHRPYRLRCDAEAAEAVEVGNGLPLGIEAGMTFESAEVTADAGDTFVLFTDGVTEARNPSGELFGEERLASAIGDGDGSAESLATAVADAVERFAERQPQSDDITLVAVRRT